MQRVIAYEYTLHGNTYHSVETASLSIPRLTRLEISAHARGEFSNRSTDARDPCNIDPLDRAGAARLTGMDQDRDRGTTTRDGLTKGSPKGHRSRPVRARCMKEKYVDISDNSR